MRKYFLLGLVAISFLITATPLPAASLLEKDMADFDKVYIPALALTNQTNKVAAQKAIALTIAQWESFKKKHAGDFRAHKDDKADLATIGQIIVDAENILKLNGKLEDTHEILEGVRNTFLTIRKRNSIDYYIDYTTKFHEVMEIIVLTAKGKTAETLTDIMLLKIRDNFQVAQQNWKNLQSASFDPELFSFSVEKDAQRKDYIKAQTEAMSKLQKALDDEDKGAIIKAAMGIKPNFVSLFLMFGDFEKVK